MDHDDEGTELSELLDSTVGPDDEQTMPLLRDGEIHPIGRMPWSSNRTFLVDVRLGDDLTQAVYKPEAGERPLWDFPAGLWRREVATHLLASALGWPVVPPTIARTDGPMGAGSLQLLIVADYSEHYFTLRDQPRHRAALEQLCALDLLANNTDRKGGHVLAGHDGRIWGVDHGLNFHAEFKLRTVMWDFAGDPLPSSLADDVCRVLDTDLVRLFGEHLDAVEVDAVRARGRALVAAGTFPHDPTGRRYPWPLV